MNELKANVNVGFDFGNSKKNFKFMNIHLGLHCNTKRRNTSKPEARTFLLQDKS
jgi:hypothetical protein